MKMELSLGSNPGIRVFPQYAFLDAILNNENTNIEKICGIYINNNTHFHWKYKNLNAQVDAVSNGIDIYRKKRGIKPIGGFYCEYKEFEEIVFNVQYMQYTNIWDKIAFFYDTEQTVLFSDDNFYDYEFSIHCCGDWRVDVKDTNVYYKINRYDDEIPKWYKIRKCNHEMQLFSSFNGKNWVNINNATLRDSVGKNAKVGFYIHLYENQYQKWICNNFIQIKFDKDEVKPIDYVGLMNRDWKNYAINPLIKFSYDGRRIIKQRGLWNYIVENICSKRYLEIWLNEYYIKGLEAFQEYTYIHESLVYGFDEKDKKVSLMSFKEGKPCLLKVPIATIEAAWKSADDNNHMIQTFEFCPDGKGYNIDIKHIYNLLEDYLTGKNSSLDFQYIAQKDSGVFGINIYNEILEDRCNKELFLEDVRIAFLIKEHKECMLFRVNFLHEYGVLNEEKYLCVIETMKDIVKNAKIILNLVIKNSLISEVKTQNSIWKGMSELCVLERECYKTLMSELDKYLRQ